MNFATPFPLDKRVFLLDTNILFLWLQDLVSDPPRDQNDIHRRERAVRFFSDSRTPLLIPGLVAVELYGVFLQKDIDPFNYSLWYRQRSAALQQLEALLSKPSTHVSLGPTLDLQKRPFFDEELALCVCKLQASSSLQRAWQQKAGTSYPDGSNRRIKGLDGMDSGLLAYAWRYAEAHPFQEVYLLSDDRSLCQSVAELHTSSSSLSIPKNLGYYHLFGRRSPERLVTQPRPPSATSVPSASARHAAPAPSASAPSVTARHIAPAPSASLKSERAASFNPPLLRPSPSSESSTSIDDPSFATHKPGTKAFRQTLGTLSTSQPPSAASGLVASGSAAASGPATASLTATSSPVASGLSAASSPVASGPSAASSPVASNPVAAASDATSLTFATSPEASASSRSEASATSSSAASASSRSEASATSSSAASAASSPAASGPSKTTKNAHTLQRPKT